MKFGTSGLRGLSVDLVGRPSAVYARAFGQSLLDSGRARHGDAIMIGRDFRDSSPQIAESCAGALASLGFSVVDCGTVPTPALALFAMRQGAASLMVTGSHIPADRNGIKFYRPDGEIDKSDELAIGALAAGPLSDETMADKTMAVEGTASMRDRSADCIALFKTRNEALLRPGALNGLRIGVYQHSTVARDLLVEVLAHYGADVVPLGYSQTFIPVDTEAVSAETIGYLQAWAASERLDAIVSADGDGDRPLVADERGIPLRGDLLGLIAANFLGAEIVVTPVTSNSAIEAAGRYSVTRTRVGSPFVIAGMDAARAAASSGIVGFEANGGTLTGTDFTIGGEVVEALPTRDSFLPILATLALRAERGEPLSQIATAHGLKAAAADRLENFPVETSAALMAYLRGSDADLAGFLAPIGTVASKSDIDGLRVTLADGRIVHFRPSGNAPEMRCYVEAEDDGAAEQLLGACLDRIRTHAATL